MKLTAELSHLIEMRFTELDVYGFDLVDVLITTDGPAVYGERPRRGHILITTDRESWTLDFIDFVEPTTCHLIQNTNNTNLIRLFDSPTIPERCFSGKKLSDDIKREIIRRRRLPFLYDRDMTKKQARRLYGKAGSVITADTFDQAIKISGSLIYDLFGDDCHHHAGQGPNRDYEKLNYLFNTIRVGLEKCGYSKPHPVREARTPEV